MIITEKGPTMEHSCAGVTGQCHRQPTHRARWREPRQLLRRRGRLCDICLRALNGSLLVSGIKARRLPHAPEPAPEPVPEPADGDDVESDWERMQDEGVYPSWT